MTDLELERAEEVKIMAQLQTQIIARRDADGFFLPPERV